MIASNIDASSWYFPNFSGNLAEANLSLVAILRNSLASQCPAVQLQRNQIQSFAVQPSTTNFNSEEETSQVSNTSQIEDQPNPVMNCTRYSVSSVELNWSSQNPNGGNVFIADTEEYLGSNRGPTFWYEHGSALGATEFIVRPHDGGKELRIYCESS